MKATTEWKFRKEKIHTYRVEDFANDWDYFIYLHLNDTARRLHLWGTLVGLSLLPWAFYRFFVHWEIIPMCIYTFFYYGVGFISHYIADGQISETWRELMKTYKYAVRLNLLSLKGSYKKEETRFKQQYPQVLWIYRKDAPAPEVVPAVKSRSKPSAPEPSHSL